MHKKHAIILAFLLTLLLSNTVFLFSQSDKYEITSITVARVIDGDTLVTSEGETVRLANINSPEKDSESSKVSKDYLSSFINKSLYLDKIKLEKYGRTLGRLYTQDNLYVNLELINLGLASKFLVDDSELKDFDKAEEKAVENQLGIWKESKYKYCISIEIYPKEEILKIENSCASVDLSGWIIKDESRKQYKFNTIIKNRLSLHSSIGNDNSTDIFWNEKTDIWNNDRDTLYLFDKEGNLAFHKSYGY
ncbi:MAG: thermonuclease family protein [Nanoarchaeota archaeon]